MTREDALRDSNYLQAPAEIRAGLTVLSVTYTGFDGLLHEGQMVAHEAVAEDMRSFFSLAQAIQFPIASVIPISHELFLWDDLTSIKRNNSSAYNFRYVTGDTSRLSKHATGHAFDINPLQNIYIAHHEDGTEACRIPEHGTYNPTAPGTLTSDHPLVHHMKRLGWLWGGDWDTPKDYQHFEKRL